MNKLVEEIIKPILEANSNIKKVVGIYGGRFQPFGPHHLKTYEWLKTKVDEAYITTSNIKNDESWIVFGNRYTENKISLDAVDVNKIELKVNESSHDIKIPKSINKKIWKFDFTKFLYFNANQNT